MRDAAAQNTLGNIYNNQGIITQGQQGNNTIIQGLPERHLTDDIKTSLLAHIPKSRKVVITALWGDQEAINFGGEIKKFLTDADYSSVEGINWGMMNAPDGTSFKGTAVNLHVDQPDNPVEINIGAAPR
jgi:hypothetical protein